MSGNAYRDSCGILLSENETGNMCEPCESARKRNLERAVRNSGMAILCMCKGYSNGKCKRCYYGSGYCRTPLLMSDEDNMCKDCREDCDLTATKKYSNRVTGVVLAVTRDKSNDDFDCICDHGPISHCKASSHWQTAK